MKMKISNPFSPVGSLPLLDNSLQREKKRERARPGQGLDRVVGCTAQAQARAKRINRLTTDRVCGNNCNWKETGTASEGGLLTHKARQLQVENESWTLTKLDLRGEPWTHRPQATVESGDSVI
ncbi:hypothetical protein FOYG_16241 [Fusarium oxysporum NRRL 32931]|uniref:Uncharacterized protein n=1 Tax=Fusarium oxysporum NRRL 32931 TaxID=660029 RepID=W9HD41_FUSOX|nr:hypothetical protein FOYG_16241 [Fusarium oxysporum NRRL 32931]